MTRHFWLNYLNLWSQPSLTWNLSPVIIFRTGSLPRGLKYLQLENFKFIKMFTEKTLTNQKSTKDLILLKRGENKWRIKSNIHKLKKLDSPFNSRLFIRRYLLDLKCHKNKKYLGKFYDKTQLQDPSKVSNKTLRK